MSQEHGGGYVLKIHIANSFISGSWIPHAYVSIEGPLIKTPVVVGYYPQVDGAPSSAGTVRNDGLTGVDIVSREPTQHPADSVVSFEISPQQAFNALSYASEVANNPGQYQLLGAADQGNIFMVNGYQCTGFARDVAIAAGIEPQVVSGEGGMIRAYPGWLGVEYGSQSINQYQPYRGSPTDSDISRVVTSIYDGIAVNDPKDRWLQNGSVEDRIRPVGEVATEEDLPYSNEGHNYPTPIGRVCRILCKRTIHRRRKSACP